ncbi:MAG TPA: GNAT family N-acetyltransferase [Alphaproteobacteria bacterium]|jgi:RimJ/RimL family protein N-acetyltransferase|nr:GNAT family N-acetyltransferase [Alphaproteobacteria bacterium]
MNVFGLIKPRIRVVAAHRIDTDRLLLRSPIAGDAEPIAGLMENWNVASWLVRVPFPYRIEHAAAWIERSIQERAAGVGWPYLIVRRNDNMLMGCMDISIETDARVGTLGYWLGEGFWGQGYATEAAKAVIGFAFDILKLSEVNASALPDNERSMRVLEKAGMTHIGRRAEDTVERGRVDTEAFVLQRRFWRG